MIIIDHVVRYDSLTPRERDRLNTSNWTMLTRLESLEAFMRCNDLLRIMRTCKRFRSLLELELYRHPALLYNRHRKRENKQLVSLLPALERSLILNEHIESVDTPCELAEEVLELFLLPNIKTIILEDLHNRDTVGCVNEMQEGMSNVIICSS
jgi:hypothetical protein